jgi:xanthine/uracil permease
MNKIGTSHIVLVDLIICGLAAVLYLRLKTLPRDNVWSRIVAVICGCSVVVILIVLSFVSDNLNQGAVLELGYIGGGLCTGLWRWHGSGRSRESRFPSIEKRS